jgi:transcription elongation factor Elf1
VTDLFTLVEPTFTLVDDGSLDTVLVCDECGAALRFTYAAWDDDDAALDDDAAYESFVDWCFEEAVNEHECHEEGA